MKKQTGFTLLELVVVIAITSILTTVVTVNFQQQKSSQEVNAAAVDFISKIREVQNNILAGKTMSGQIKPATAYQIVLTTNSNSYRIDYDMGGTINTLETVTLSANIRVNQVYIDGSPVGNTTLRIASPYGEIRADGVTNKVVKVDLINTATSAVRAVIIDGISGRIGLQ